MSDDTPSGTPATPPLPGYPEASAPQPAYPQAGEYAAPAYPQSEQGGYAGAGYPQQQPYGYAAPYGYAPKTNSLAIVSLVAGIAAFVVLPFIASIVAVITGHISLKQLRTSGEAGRGMALWGTILGYVGIGLAALGVVLVIIWVMFVVGVASSTGSTYYNS